jgi:uncharacterized protein YcbK (DUF882 family)
MKISPHFDLVEFACKDGSSVPAEFVDNVRVLCLTQLEPLRELLGNRPIRIISGYRSPQWNLGRGVKDSQHLTASAADIRVAGLSVEQMHRAVIEGIEGEVIRDGGVGRYPVRPGRRAGWIHVDCGPAGRRWRG